MRPEQLDAGVLRDLIAVESECCPFLLFDFDENLLRLRVGVEDPEHEPALAAIGVLVGVSAERAL